MTLDDTAMTSVLNDVGSAFRAALGTLFVPQSTDGVWIGSKRYADLPSAMLKAAEGDRVEARGAFHLDEPLVIDQAGVQLVGGGPRQTVITGGGTSMIQVGSLNSGAYVDGVKIADLKLAGAAGPTYGVRCLGMRFSVIEDVHITGLADTGATGLVLDGQSVGSYLCSIHNTIRGGWIGSCYHGLRVTKNPADPGTDGSNHNGFYSLNVSAFSGIGVNVNAGENNSFYQLDSSTGYSGTTGVRINDDMCALYSPRCDNSSAGVGLADAYGIYITAAGRDHFISNQSGNGPISSKRLYMADPSTPGYRFRNNWP